MQKFDSKNLVIHSPQFITLADGQFTFDVLGGVDVQQVENMICTLRISHKNYPPFRTTIDLYSDSQTDKLIRSLCDKYSVTLVESSKSVHALIGQLENYRFNSAYPFLFFYFYNSKHVCYCPFFCHHRIIRINRNAINR